MMAANTLPVFPAGGFDPALLDQQDSDRTGAGTYDTILTAGSNGALLTGIQFTNVTSVGQTRIYIFHKQGSTTLFIGELPVPANSPTSGTAAWVGLWSVPGGKMIIDSGDSILASYATGSGYKFHAWPLGGQL